VALGEAELDVRSEGGQDALGVTVLKLLVDVFHELDVAH
jgi:hypothetical protein